MQRRTLVPPNLSDEALNELKEWLAITTPNEDAALTRLLRAALDLCEGFTGQMPLHTVCEEVLPACGMWHSLAARPVHAITAVEAVPAQGPRFALAPEDYELELGAHGKGLVRILRQGLARQVAVRFTAGLAAEWSGLPEGLRHGILRMAAHYHERDRGDASAVAPASVAALWRPWRQFRLT